MSEQESEKLKKHHIVLIVLGILLLFNLPIPICPKDGTYTVFSLCGSYYIRHFTQVYRYPEIDGVHYTHSSDPQEGRYNFVGKKIYIFFIKVYDSTHCEPEMPTELPHEDDLRELIAYGKNEEKILPVPNSISVDEDNGNHTVKLGFGKISELDEANELYLSFLNFLKTHPDNFLNDGYDITLSMGGSRKSGRRTYTVCDIDYSFNSQDPGRVDLWMSYSMIPEELPEYRSFVDADHITVKIYSDKPSLAEEKEKMLKSIYPHAEITVE